MTSTHRPHTVDHHMTRVDIPTGMAFDSFCDAFEQAVPAFDAAHIRHITENGGTWEDIAAAVAANAPNEMMRYATLDMTALYATTNHRTKAVEYFVGNHGPPEPGCAKAHTARFSGPGEPSGRRSPGARRARWLR